MSHLHTTEWRLGVEVLYNKFKKLTAKKRAKKKKKYIYIYIVLTNLSGMWHAQTTRWAMPKYVRYSNIVTRKKYHQNTMERRSVTSRYHGSTISGWQQNRWRRRRQEERQKIMCLYQETTTLQVHHAIFNRFLYRRCATTTWNFLISRAFFMK